MHQQQFNPRNPLVILAPHLQYPNINGADISIDRVGKYCSELVPYVDIIATNQIIRYKNKEIISIRTFDNKIRSKKSAAFHALILRTNYLKEKFNTKNYKKVLINYLNTNNLSLNILCSFFYSADLLDSKIKENNFCMIWTHNDDYKWFRDFLKSQNSFLTKLVATFSLKWTKKFIEKNKKNFLLLHVDDNDIKGYNNEHDGLRNMRVSIGTDIPSNIFHDFNCINEDQIVLSFIGSLSVQMNVDALILFKNDFYEPLKKVFKDNLIINVIGSNPTDTVVEFCNILNWSLNANVSDEKMIELLNSTTFTIMPFYYTNGAKLKMLYSLGNGVPILATYIMKNQMANIPPHCLYSDDINVWIDHIKMYQKKTILERKNAYLEIREFAQHFSWCESVNKMIRELKDTSV